MVASDDDTIENALAAVTASQWTHLQTLVEAVDPRQPGVWEGGEEVVGSTPEAFREFLQREQALWRGVIRRLGLH